MAQDTNEPQDFAGLFDMLRGLRGDFAAARRQAAGDGRRDTGKGGHDVRAAVLGLLAESPKHGAQLIRDIADRSTDGWQPAAAEVYPTLQLLVDEGLATVAEDDGRRTYTLTEAGRDEATADDDSTGDDGEGTCGRFAPLTQFAQFAGDHGDLPKAGLKLGQAVRQVAVGGDAAQTDRVVALLDETRRKVYAILAEDSSDSSGSTDDDSDGNGGDSDGTAVDPSTRG
ncbi:PadR family transcriptional regulator [Corynebacterium nuruki]|uniref:PadR family transcriptional regulator n=1 Tax=Corynebacterium nuruki TaxID=1032851 RepID=UPI0002486D8B|nr:PadR family transcriptional regulator [Corynebacterium nuruki]